jgi:hypothetical protein
MFFAAALCGEFSTACAVVVRGSGNTGSLRWWQMLTSNRARKRYYLLGLPKLR